MEGREYRPCISTKEVKGTISNVASTGTTKYRHYSCLERHALRVFTRKFNISRTEGSCRDWRIAVAVKKSTHNRAEGLKRLGCAAKRAVVFATGFVLAGDGNSTEKKQRKRERGAGDHSEMREKERKGYSGIAELRSLYRDDKELEVEIVISLAKCCVGGESPDCVRLTKQFLLICKNTCYERIISKCNWEVSISKSKETTRTVRNEKKRDG
ncbi:hypothetical protein M8C21_032095, partial [Ambrosia artemisiifolia]